MLTKLLPEQISKNWDVIRYAIQESLPPTVGQNPDRMTRILSAALSGKISIWASYTREDGGMFEGILVTKILYDESSDTRNLLLYCLYGYTNSHKDTWTVGLKAVLKYAKANNCQQIVGYTDVPYIVELVNSLGGNTDYTFLSFDVGDYDG